MISTVSPLLFMSFARFATEKGARVARPSREVSHEPYELHERQVDRRRLTAHWMTRRSFERAFGAFFSAPLRLCG
jgi:hypothetical protein